MFYNITTTNLLATDIVLLPPKSHPHLRLEFIGFPLIVTTVRHISFVAASAEKALRNITASRFYAGWAYAKVRELV